MVIVEAATKLSDFAHFWRGAESLAPATEATSEPSKVVRACGVFNILTWKCASRHNRVHFFDMSTSKSGPRMVCFVHFGNVLRATTACNFSSLIWPHGSAPAALASLLFDPPEPQIIRKNTEFRDIPTFSRPCIFFLLTLSLLWSSLFCSSPLWLFPPLLFHLSILSEVWLLNFLRFYRSDQRLDEIWWDLIIQIGDKTERQKDRKREGEKDRKTDRQMDGPLDRHIDKQIDRYPRFFGRCSKKIPGRSDLCQADPPWRRVSPASICWPARKRWSTRRWRMVDG